MCLKIDKSVKLKKPNKDGFCIGWKLVREDNSALIQSSYKYEVGLNFSDRIEYPELEDEEKAFNSVDYGFHLFLQKNGAKKLLEYRINRYGKDDYKNKCKLIKVFYKPKDVVAYGTMEYNSFAEDELNKVHNVVVNKLTIKSLKREKL
jgi:hypothetical protein